MAGSIEKILRYHETGGHEGDGSDATLRKAREELAELYGERRFLYRWVERGLFDKAIGMKGALASIANYPGAPWKNGRWDVDHKPYADAFYKLFPKARG